MPAARDNHAMAHDPGQGTVVLFGGRNNPSGFLGDTWLWNGTTQSWTQATPANAPTARQSHSMAFDATLGVVVLTGGVGAGGNLADVWHWNGANWTQAAGAFPARYGHGTAYDQTRSELLLTGGISLVADTHVREHALVTMPAACRLFGPGCAGPSGALPRMGTDTCPRIGQTFTLQFTNLPVSPGVIGVDTAATTIGNGACAWHLGAGAPVVFPYTGTSASHAIPIPNIVGLVGTLFFNQAAALDGGGLALSNSSEGRIGL
jgi:hypothetical protein